MGLCIPIRHVVLMAALCGFTAISARAQNGELVSAAKRGDLAAVKQLLASGADVNERKFTILNQSGDSTALMEASFRGYLEIVQVLLAAKADLDATLSEKKDGPTALTFAVERRNVKIAQALLAANADVNHPCCDGANALYEAASKNNLDMVKFF